MLYDMGLCSQLSCGLVLGGGPKDAGPEPHREAYALFLHLLMTLEKSKHLCTWCT